jgi:hypothetical protein
MNLGNLVFEVKIKSSCIKFLNLQILKIDTPKTHSVNFSIIRLRFQLF